MENVGKKRELFDIRKTLSAFPLGYRLPADAKPVGKLFLRHIVCSSEFCDFFSDHSYPLCRYIVQEKQCIVYQLPGAFL